MYSQYLILARSSVCSRLVFPLLLEDSQGQDTKMALLFHTIYSTKGFNYHLENIILLLPIKFSIQKSMTAYSHHALCFYFPSFLPCLFLFGQPSSFIYFSFSLTRAGPLSLDMNESGQKEGELVCYILHKGPSVQPCLEMAFYKLSHDTQTGLEGEDIQHSPVIFLIINFENMFCFSMFQFRNSFVWGLPSPKGGSPGPSEAL